MKNKSKFITAGLCAITLGLCMVHYGNGHKYPSQFRKNVLLVGIVVLVSGVGSASIGFTSKEK